MFSQARPDEYGRCSLWLKVCHLHWKEPYGELHRSAHSTSGLQGALGGNKQNRAESDLITVEDIVKHHWQEFGRSAVQMLPAQAIGSLFRKLPVFLKLALTFVQHPDVALQQL